MKNYVQPGKTVTVAAPATVSSGKGVLVGGIFGIAGFDAAAAADVEIATEGVFDIDKVSAQAWSQGDAIYWDNAAKLATTVVAAGNVPIGHALLAAANPSGTGRVRLEHAAAGGQGAIALNPVVTLTDGDSGYVVSPVAGKITRIESVLLGGAVVTNNAVVTGKIGAAGAGVAITGGALTVTASGSAAGDIDTASPTALNTVAVGSLIYFTVSGTPGGGRTAQMSIQITP